MGHWGIALAFDSIPLSWRRSLDLQDVASDLEVGLRDWGEVFASNAGVGCQCVVLCLARCLQQRRCSGPLRRDTGRRDRSPAAKA